MSTVLLVLVAAFAVLIATYLGLWLLESRRPRVLCLMYHRLAPQAVWEAATGTERIFTLPAEEFERQMGWLRDTGCSFLTPDDLCAYAAGEKDLPDRSVLITFDDGCLSVLERGLPVLRENGATGTVFVTTDPGSYVFQLGADGDRRMTDEELRLADQHGLTCGSHSVTHRPLSGLGEEEIRRELRESKSELERILGREVSYLAIPGNWFDRRVMAIAREVGYRAVWCSNPTTMRRASTLFGLPRINVEGNLTLEQFKGLVQPSGVALRRLLSIIKRAPGRLLGPRVWLPFRKTLMRLIPGGYISTRRLAGAAGAVLLIVILAWVLIAWMQ